MTLNRRLVHALDRRFYPHHSDNWDDALFRSAVLERLQPDSVLLDVGAGAGIVAQMDFRGLAARIIGVDPDPRVLENPYLNEAHVGLGDAMPFLADGSCDIVISDNVLEHVEHPAAFMAEVARVLRPGGLLITKTPNRRHYMPCIARITPHWFHRFYNSLRGREAKDTFPTRYRLNRPAAQRRFATASGLEVLDITAHEGRPEYLRISFPTYLFGIGYERIVNALGLDGMKILLVSVFRKRV